MTVVIDTPVTENPSPRSGREGRGEIQSESNEAFLAGVLGQPRRLHFLSRSKLHLAANVSDSGNHEDRDEAPTVSLGLQALHRCFATHTPFSLSPDVAWYMIAYEVAEHVRQHPDQHADLFTHTPGNTQLITVRDGSLRYHSPSDWQRSIGLVREAVRDRLSDQMLALFLPDFSTSSDEARTAILVAFMDVISPYYEFEWMTMCGIPQIRLEGTAADWTQLVDLANRLAARFDGLTDYFADLMPVLEVIAETADRGRADDLEFWRSIYKRRDSSGGPYVSGWVTAFFAHIQTPAGPVAKPIFDWSRLADDPSGGFETNAFPSHVSRVPFRWRYFNRTYAMSYAAGVFGVDYSDGFLSPQLGFAVVEN